MGKGGVSLVLRRQTATRAHRAIGAGTIAVLLLLGACGDDDSSSFADSRADGPPPWQRSESRDDCADFDLTRRPFFGDLHVHTAYSADAVIFGTRTVPRDAYRFATGGEIALSDSEEQPTRRVRIDRPLDFAAVTDHAEWLGEVRLCSDPESAAYDIEECRRLRQSEDPAERFPVTVTWLFPAGISPAPPSLPFCETEGLDCDAAAGSAWGDTQLAAEEAYDRSSSCAFTTFVGYENTASPLGRHRHRNVIFRNAVVPELPASQLETERGGFPQGLWTAIEDDCTNSDDGCDAVIIAHNSNLSGGEQFVDPLDRADAQRRRDLEPLVEIFQHKGASECRFDRLAGAGVGTEDELCTFEQLLVPHELPGTAPPSVADYPRRNLVRNVLKDGLSFEATIGANPFQLGFIASTDTHDSTAGGTDESDWKGAQGSDDATPQRLISENLRNNPGGLAVVWAEENSRDAIFAALRRRETYATSGTRPLLRFFAGELHDLRCGDPDFVATAYRHGAPMGGEVGIVDGRSGPSFAVLAFKDPGTPDRPGTDLRQVQIVKGWLDRSGVTRERVFDIAGDAGRGGIDPRTCGPARAGFATSCTIWQDPEFDPEQRAFYYVRLLESPTCRWSTLVCRRSGVDPFASDCAERAEEAGAAFAACCAGDAEDPFRERVIQERAWSSPIWYRPEAIATVEAGIDVAPSGSLDLTIRIGRLPDDVDPSGDEITISIEDDEEIYALTLRGGTLAPSAGGRRYSCSDGCGSHNGVRSLSVDLDEGRGATIHLRAENLDFVTATQGEYAVRVRLAIGSYRAEHTRFWRGTSTRLGPA